MLWPYKDRRDSPLEPLLGAVSGDTACTPAQTHGNALGNARGIKHVPGKRSGTIFGTKRSGK